MFTPSEVKIILAPWEVAQVERSARAVEMGGASNIHADDAERMAKLVADQYAGQAGEAALSKYLTGSIDLWRDTRKRKMLHPNRGDDGVDLLGYCVDVKCSVARFGPRYNYHLWVRDGEFHPRWVYVLALILPGGNWSDVYLVGWKRAESLHPDEQGRFGGLMRGLWHLPVQPDPERIARLGWRS